MVGPSPDMPSSLPGWLWIAAVAGPLIISAVLCAWVRVWARRRGFVDLPGGHKAHAAPVPLGGGIAVFAATSAAVVGGILVAVAMDLDLWPRGWPALHPAWVGGIRARAAQALGILAGAAGIFALGLLDDRRALRAGPKLLVQIAVALWTVIVLDIRALEMLGSVPSAVLSVLWIVIVTNAFNFLDNMDGLSAGAAIIAGGVFAAAATLNGQVFVPMFTLVLVGAAGGFLIHNFPPARLYMGDAGSLVIGYLISTMTILTTFHDPARGPWPIEALIPLVVLAVPLYDFFSVIVLRLRAGSSPLSGDRRHFSHRLLGRGLGPRGALLTVYCATAATGLGAILLPRLDAAGAVLVFAQTLLIVLLIALLEQGGSGGPPRA